MIEKNAIKLPKLGRVRCRISRRPQGRILSVTVFQNPGGRYGVSVCCTDIEPQILPKTGRAAGLHLGITNLVTTSDGEHFENPRYFEKSEKKIARLTRRLSRKPKDSNNRGKARIKLARAHERVANQRNDYLNKLSTELVRKYDAICVRDAKPSALTRDKRFAKLATDAGHGALLAKLRYKCAWYGKDLIMIDAYFPSVRTCSVCGSESAEVGRRNAIREWECPECGSLHERGVNAALNVLNEGLRVPAAEVGDIRAGKSSAPSLAS
jgi:putative transposase